MTHYIDADRLRAEIERLNSLVPYDNDRHSEGLHDAYKAVKNVIDSLQQEQSDFPTTDEQVKEFLATHPKVEVPRKYKTPDWIFEKSENPMNLEEEISRTYHDGSVTDTSDLDHVSYENVARHFAEWGAKHAKEQMLKEAVEYDVGMHGEPIQITLDKYVQRAKGIFPGDKVRIIIVKEDEK